MGDKTLPLLVRHWEPGPEADQVTIRLTRTPTEDEKASVENAVQAFRDTLKPPIPSPA